MASDLAQALSGLNELDPTALSSTSPKTKEKIDGLALALRKKPVVAQVRHISKDEAMKELEPWIGRVRIVEDDIGLMAVRRAASTFNLGADEIIYLNDLGVPSAVVTSTGRSTRSAYDSTTVRRPAAPRRLWRRTCSNTAAAWIRPL